MKKRKNPYNYKDVMEKHNCSEEKAKKMVQNLKDKTSGSLKTFQKRYGTELGKQKYEEFCDKSANTKEKFQHKYGENWEEKWCEYLKTKDSTSLEFHIKKYGKINGPIEHKKRLENIKTDLQSYIKRYGDYEGTLKYNEANEKRSYACSKEGLIEKYGIEKATDICKSKANIGENNGMYGISPPAGSGNGWSGWYKNKHFRSILELSYMKYLDDKNIEYKSAETKEFLVTYEIQGVKKTYKPDFYVNGDIIEIKPKNLINTFENTEKFKAAVVKFGSNFKVLTEHDFEVIKDLSELIESGDVELTERYKRKYNENYKN